jgi:hypothetical protein
VIPETSVGMASRYNFPPIGLGITARRRHAED